MASLSVPKTLSFASAGCEVRNGTWEPHVLSSEADDVVIDCSSESVNHVSCKNPDRDEYISEVNGLAFDTPLDQSALPSLPKFIPIMEKSFLGMNPDNLPCTTVGISVADIFTSAVSYTGGQLRATNQFISDKRVTTSEIMRRKQVLLFMSGQDALIEPLWQEQFNINLFPSIYEMGFRMATTPNYSVFVGECPVGHAINQKKSMVCGKRLQDAGVTPILHIYPMTEQQMVRYVQYLRDNSRVRTVIMNCTLQRKSAGENEFIRKIIARLLSDVGDDLHIILQGLNIKRAAELCEFGDNLHFAVSTPFFQALFKTENVFDPSMRDILTFGGSKAPKEALAAGNIYAYAEFLDKICAVK